MKTTIQQQENHLKLAETYYQHILQKNVDAIAACLHPNVHFISPLAELSEKAAVLEAAKNLGNILTDIIIHAKFNNDNQVILVYDFMFPAPIGKLRAAGLIGFNDNLISKIELFYDGRPFEDMKNQIFSNK